MAEWVALQPIFEVCVNGTGYEGRGRHCETWRRKAADNKQMRYTLEDVLAAARDWRGQESGRRGRGKGWEERTNYESGG